MGFKRYTGSAQTDVANLKQWHGSNWVNCKSLKRWDGSNWIEVLNGFRVNHVIGTQVTSAVSNGAWTCVAANGGTSGDGYVVGSGLFLFPIDSFTLPLTLEADYEFTNSGAGTAGTIYLGTFDSAFNMLSGHSTSTTFARTTRSVSLPANANAKYLGVNIGLNNVKQISTTVYSLKIDGQQIPIIGG